MRLTLILLSLLLTLNSYGESSSQSWSLLRKSFPSSSSRWDLQLQHRYNFDDEKLYEEQINISHKKDYNWGQMGLLFTLGTNDGHERLKEYRYALQYNSSPYDLNTFTYKFRLRQEVRFFKGYSQEAYRFRLRQKISHPLNQSSKISFSSEFNYYLNEFQPEHQGLSSHRSIVDWKIKEESFSWSIAYIHDYGDLARQIRIRNILRFALYF